MSEKFAGLDRFETISEEELAEINGGFWGDFFGGLLGGFGPTMSADEWLRTVNHGTGNGYSTYFPEYNPSHYWY